MATIETGSFPQPKPEPVHFIEAIDFLRSKTRLPTRVWTDLWQDQHSRAFVVAGAMHEALVADFHVAVTKAIAEGRTIEDFRKDFDRIVAAHGWDYKGGRNWRSRVIFETNLRTAYGAGRWAQAVRLKAVRPWLRYVHGDSVHPRPHHLAWHNTILPVDHPWWKTHFTPNGWGCQCSIQSVSDADLKRHGWKVSEQAPSSRDVAHTLNTPDGPRTVMVPEGIDPGFAYNPGEGAFGRGAQEIAMERHGGFAALEAPGPMSETAGPLEPAATTTRPARVPPARPDGTPDETALRKLFHVTLGSGEAIFRDPTGAHVSVTEAVVKHLIAKARENPGEVNRAAYWPFIRELIETPHEIWQGFAKSEVSGRVAMRRRYVKLVRLSRDRVIALVADEAGGNWQALTFFTGDPVSNLANLRAGVLVYQMKPGEM